MDEADTSARDVRFPCAMLCVDLCPVPSFEGIGQQTKGTKMSQVPTTRLNNGMEVLAKQYKGELYAVTYANRTQAFRKARELGKGWAVYS